MVAILMIELSLGGKVANAPLLLLPSTHNGAVILFFLHTSHFEFALIHASNRPCVRYWLYQELFMYQYWSSGN